MPHEPDSDAAAKVAGETVGVILAGGAGRRMGGASKATLPLAGRTMLDHVLGNLAPQVRRIAVSVHAEQEAFDRPDIAQITDASDERIGPVAGLASALRWAAGQPGARWLATAPVDMPLLPATIVAELVLGARSADAAAASAANRGQLHPTVSVWSLALADDVLRLIDEQEVRALHDLLRRTGARQVDFADDDAFLNVNTPEDLRAAEFALAGRKQRL